MSQMAESQLPEMLGAAFLDHDADAASKQTEAENVRRLERLLVTFMSGNYEALEDLLADDVEMEILGPADAFMVGRHEGRSAVTEAIRSNFAMVEEQHPTIESVVAQGDQVVLVGRDHGRVRSTGRPYDIGLVQIYTFRDGKVVSMREVADTVAWLEAAGRKV